MTTVPLSPPEQLLARALLDVRHQRGAIASLALAFGLVSFERNIPAWSLATGIPITDLRDATIFCREVLADELQHVPNQHLVSQAILKRFAVHSQSGYRLKEYEVRVGPRRGLTSVKRACTVQNFVKLDSRRAEEHWGRYESRFPVAIKSVSDGSIFEKPEEIETIKDVIALHFARSHEVAVNSEILRGPGLSTFMTVAGLDDSWVRQAHLDRFGLDVTDIVLARERLENVLTTEYEMRRQTGVYFRLRVPDHFRNVRRILAGRRLQVLRPFNPESEFVIGDNPVITPNATEDRLGILDGVPIGDATMVMMPLTPRATVVLSDTEGDEQVDDARVDQLNGHQIHKAFTSVFMRPGSSLEQSVTRLLPIDNAARWSVA